MASEQGQKAGVNNLGATTPVDLGATTPVHVLDEREEEGKGEEENPNPKEEDNPNPKEEDNPNPKEPLSTAQESVSPFEIEVRNPFHYILTNS